MAEDKKAVADLTFREASTELEQVVRSLENDDLDLEVALERYARGVELLKSLRERLNDAEKKVNVLIEANDNTSA